MQFFWTKLRKRDRISTYLFSGPHYVRSIDSFQASLVFFYSTKKRWEYIFLFKEITMT